METATPLSIEEVWGIFLRQRDQNTRNFLLLYYLPSVKSAAERLHSKLPDRIELDDLISAGIFGLMKAIDTFDPKHQVDFETYGIHRIRGAILDELRHLDWVPRLVRQKARILMEVRRTLEAKLGRSPTEVEMAEKLGLDMEEFWRFQRDANAVGLVSLHKSFKEGDGDDDYGEINIQKNLNSRNPLTEVQKRDLLEFISKGFTRIERLVIVLYYYEKMTMREIGLTLGISESRVCQIHTSIIARLRIILNHRERDFDL
jgi:RNA polymerase sigma factor for flagellar operon FliA